MRYRHEVFSRLAGTKRKTKKKLDELKRTFRGIVFHSIEEGKCYEALLAANKKVEVQPKVDCVVNGALVTRYAFDFLVTEGRKKFYVEYKGYWEQESKLRFKLALACSDYPVAIYNKTSVRWVELGQNGRVLCKDGDKWRQYRWGETDKKAKKIKKL